MPGTHVLDTNLVRSRRERHLSSRRIPHLLQLIIHVQVQMSALIRR